MSVQPAEANRETFSVADVIPDTLEGQWWVAHTKARNEKALTRDLDCLGIYSYLPLRKQVSKSRRTGRTTFSTVPVFTGYLFFNATESQRYQVLATNRVARALYVPEQDQLVDQLRDIHQLLTTDMAFEHFSGVRVGEWVRVVAGPLMGVDGRVCRKLGRTRLALNVDILGQAVLVEIEADLLERIDSPARAKRRG